MSVQTTSGLASPAAAPPSSLLTQGGTRRTRALLLAPPAIIVSMYLIFRVAMETLGNRRGIVVGFTFYWLVWGIAFPVTILGAERAVDLLARSPLRSAMPRWGAIGLLLAPAVYGFLFVFPSALPDVTDRQLVTVALYALVNGVLEEVLWRGTFARTFPDDMVRGYLYPAVAFALWHLVPISLLPLWPPGGPIVVVGAAMFMGLLYGWIAWRTGSIRWTAMAHVLTNLSGIGVLLVVLLW